MSEYCGHPLSNGDTCGRRDPAHKGAHRGTKNLENNKRLSLNGNRATRVQGGRIYAIHFPAIDLLKVGFSSYKGSYALVAARNNARRRLGIAEGVEIWTAAGDFRHEAFVQAVLAFKYDQPEAGGSRLSEWFLVPSLSPEAIISDLDKVVEIIHSL